MRIVWIFLVALCLTACASERVPSGIWLTVTPAVAPVGAPVQINGSGALPNSMYRLTVTSLDDNRQVEDGWIPTDAHGHIRVVRTFGHPPRFEPYAPGHYEILIRNGARQIYASTYLELTQP